MEYEDRRTISTPEGIDLELPLAGLGSRFTGLLLDTLIQFAAITIAVIALEQSGSSGCTAQDSGDRPALPPYGVEVGAAHPATGSAAAMAIGTIQRRTPTAVRPCPRPLATRRTF